MAAEKREIRCIGCGKLMGVTNGDTDFVCTRCGALNRYHASTQSIDYTPKCDRATLQAEGR